MQGLSEPTPVRPGAGGWAGRGPWKAGEVEPGMGRAGGRADSARVTLPEPAAEAAGLSSGGDGVATSLGSLPRCPGITSPRPAVPLLRPRRVIAGPGGQQLALYWRGGRGGATARGLLVSWATGASPKRPETVIRREQRASPSGHGRWPGGGAGLGRSVPGARVADGGQRRGL